MIAKLGQHTCENCELEPLDAIVERIKQDNVEVVWMEGGSKAWRVAKWRTLPSMAFKTLAQRGVRSNETWPCSL